MPTITILRKSPWPRSSEPKRPTTNSKEGGVSRSSWRGRNQRCRSPGQKDNRQWKAFSIRPCYANRRTASFSRSDSTGGDRSGTLCWSERSRLRRCRPHRRTYWPKKGLDCRQRGLDCVVFPATAVVAVEIGVTVNQERRWVAWGTTLRGLLPVVRKPAEVSSLAELRIERLHQGKLTPVEFDRNDLNILQFPLLPGDRIRL